ncbi:TonB-dependent receptor [Pseudoxanthomonas sp. GM95]|uniref:TonB-dependent receptor n=1 Tax=Pseudoxanthomonas sp. GM95 TaxID=1881043 RepID=UPI0020C89992|nr:TonB-dependent receptor [Pseudoxanthomonas sp. GM95]
MISHTRLPKLRLGSAIALALATVPSLALAQQDQADSTAHTLKNVTVTADKRPEDIQKVPMSISVVDPEKLAAYGASGDTLVQLAGRSPSLQVESSYGRTFPRFYIRGLGNTDYDANASQPVSLVFDDIVQENPLLKGFPMFDLDQVEVLRGPQGTMFGRNSPAGVVKFDSAKPTEETEGYAKVSYGTFGTANVEGAISGKLGNNGWTGRASFLVQHRDHWIDNAYTGKHDALGGYNDRALRLQAMYTGEDFDALLSAHVRDYDGSAAIFRPNAVQQGTPALVPGFDIDRVASDGRNTESVTSWGASAKLNWYRDGLTFTSITGLERVRAFSLGDVDGGYLASAGAPVWAMPSSALTSFSQTADEIPQHRQITQELRVANDAEARLRWQTGLYYFYENIDINNFNYDHTGTTRTAAVRQHQATSAAAVFGSLAYRFTDRFDVRAGLRYSHEDKDYTVQRFYGYTGALGPIDVDQGDAHWSGDLTGTFTLTDRVSVYGRFANGFRAPSVQGRLTGKNNISTAKAETINSLEFGVKSTGLDGRLRFNADVYGFVMHDQQVTAVAATSNATDLVNIDRTDGYGAEFDLEFSPNANWAFTLGGSYNETEIKDPDLAVAACSNCTVLDPRNANRRALIDGNSLPRAAKYIGAFTARYSLPVGDTGEVFAYTDWNYRSKLNQYLYNSVEYNSKAVLLGGLRVGYNWDLGKQEVALYARNLTDRRVIIATSSFISRAAMVNDPRIIGVEYSLHF